MQYMPGNRAGQGPVGREIERLSEAHPDRAAVVCTGCAPLSYGELQDLIDDVRANLRGAGFGCSARIAITLPNGPHGAVAIVAIACSAVAVPLNPNLTVDEIKSRFATLRPDAVLLHRGVDSAVRRVAEGGGWAVIEADLVGEGRLGLKIVVPQSGAIAPPNDPDPDAPAFILQSSGTTSDPKLIPFSHRNMLAAAARHKAWYDLTAEDRCLSLSPVFYSHGLKVTVFTPLLTGGTVAFPADASRFDYAEWFSALKPTWYSAGPTLHHLIFDKTRSRADAKAGHSLRFITGGGAPLRRDVLEGLQDTLGVPVVEHYGSSEAALIASNEPRPGRSKPGTCGTPWPGTVMIVDEDGRQLPAGKQGEILIGGPTLIAGYLNAPELNQASFVDGWFKTEDIGSLDEEGFLTLHGRLKDLINRGGEKISPPEIDGVLMRHPAVAEAAAFAVPHKRLGQEVAAAVVLKRGAATSPHELRHYVSERLAAFKVPRRIVILDQLPKGSTGKVIRRQLSESFATGANAPSAATNASDGGALSAQLIKVWERLLETTPITIDDNFFEKGGDSLLAVEMFLEIERMTGIHIPLATIVFAPTVRALAQRLERKGGPQQEALIELKKGGPRNLFLVHDGDGETLLYFNLARRMPDDLAVFGIEPRRIDGVPLAYPSIEQVAACYLEEVREQQPQGPYLFGGLCAGGVIAYEMAAQIERAGESVELVVLLDAAVPRALMRRGLVAKARFGRLQQSFEQARNGAHGRVQQARLVISVISQKVKNALIWEIAQRGKRWLLQARFRLGFVQGLSVRQIYDAVEGRYVPRPLSVASVVLARAQLGEGGDTAYRHIYSDESFGWGGLAHDLMIVDVDGGHFSMLQENFVDSLAEALRPYVGLDTDPPVCEREIQTTAV